METLKVCSNLLLFFFRRGRQFYTSFHGTFFPVCQQCLKSFFSPIIKSVNRNSFCWILYQIQDFSSLAAVLLEGLGHEEFAQVLRSELLDILGISINLTCQQESKKKKQKKPFIIYVIWSEECPLTWFKNSQAFTVIKHTTTYRKVET